MAHRQWTALLLVVLVAGLGGCSNESSGSDVSSHDDAGTDVDAETAGDGGADADADTGGDGAAEADAEDSFDGYCTSDPQCDDHHWCNGAEHCAEHTCVSGADPCDDRVDCTVDTCDEDLDRCYHTPDNSMCQNGVVCDGEEQCLPGTPGTGCSGGEIPDCTDDSYCTIDHCVEASGGCVHIPRDLDGDTFISSDHVYGCDGAPYYGTDCNDSDPSIHPGAVEICDDSRDNDCDTLIDFGDPDCRPANDTCSAPVVLEDGVEVRSSTNGTTGNYTLPCYSYPYDSHDVTFEITLADTADIVVDVEAVGTVYVDLERSCGVTSSSVRCQYGSSIELRRNSQPAGTYYVIVQSNYGTSDFTISYHTEGPTPIPPNDTCAGAIDIPSTGGVVSGTLMDTSNNYVPSCAYGAAYPDVFYRLVLTEPHKITITGQSGTSSYYTYVSLMTSCGDVGSELACGTGTTATITRNFLDAGTYYIAFDSSDEGPFTLSVLLQDPIYPPANDRCPGTDVSGGGMFTGTMVDTYRDYPPSCSTASLSDLVYTFTLAEAQDVTAIVTPLGSSTTYVVALRTTCGDGASEIACRSGNPAQVTRHGLPAGTYYVIVSGPTTSPGNQFLLQLTMSPPSPVPVNDVCMGAVDVSAGGVFTGTTVDATDDYDPTCGTAAGYPDIVYGFSLATPQDVTLSLSSAAPISYLDLRSGACGTGTTSLRCTSGATPTTFTRSVPAGSYWVLVDTSAEVATTLNVTFASPTTVCDGAPVINIDYGAGSTFTDTVSGFTSGRPSDFTATCAGGAGGPDQPYEIIVPVRSAFSATVTASSYDTALHLRTPCSAGSTQLYCDDDGGPCSLCSRIPASSGTVTLDPGTYYLIMDTYGSGGTGGSYTLSISATAL